MYYEYMIAIPAYYGITDWLVENCSGDYEIYEPLQWGAEIHFELAEDAMAFKLKWI